MSDFHGLNLGCGKVSFPIAKDNPLVAHISYALDANCLEAYDPDAKWTNVDRIALKGVNEVIDIFQYPWLRSNGAPFSDNTFDKIWCSHILEHIPHKAEFSPGANNYPALVKIGKDDGWWAFFCEAWRVLKPGGRMCIVAPNGNSTAGQTDPTHTRLLSIGTFSYFNVNPDAPFNYDFPFTFMANGAATAKVIGKAQKLADTARQLEKTLEGMPKDNSQYAAVSRAAKEMQNEFEDYIQGHFNAMDEFSLTLTAVKDVV